LPCESVMVMMVLLEGRGDMRHADHDILLSACGRGAPGFRNSSLSHLLVHFFFAGDSLGRPLRVRAWYGCAWHGPGRLLR